MRIFSSFQAFNMLLQPTVARVYFFKLAAQDVGGMRLQFFLDHMVQGCAILTTNRARAGRGRILNDLQRVAQ